MLHRGCTMGDTPSSANYQQQGAQLSPVSDLERNQTVSLLFDLSRELTSILERDELLLRIADRVKRIVNYHLFNLMLWNEATSNLECAFTKHYEEAISVQLAVPLYKGITGHAAGYRCPVRVADVRLDQRYVEFPHSDNVRSELVVPLLLQNRVVGVLDLESTQLGAFTTEHEHMLEILGSFIAIALENSRLYEQTRTREQNLQRDLDTARTVQRQLLPQGSHSIPGLDVASAYMPARQLAGDFYDFLPYGNSRLGVALGDVSGKGTAAALYGSLTVGILREFTRDHRCWPEEMLSVLNARLNAAQMSPSYVALTFAVYDGTLRNLMIANAGIPRPILVRNHDIQELKIDGIPLGMFSDSEYETLTLPMHGGDIVVFASDGILESMNLENETFGTERLFELLRKLSPGISSQSIAAAIMEATDEFSGRPTEAHDDRTLIILQLTVDDEPQRIATGE
jgi:phosphoserine phosphatase RsbU/P